MAAVGGCPSVRAALLRRLARAMPVLCLATAVVLPTLARAQPADAIERQVKAAYVSKFASYVDWPPPAFDRIDAPITIGVLGDDAMAAYVGQMVAGRMVNGRPMKVLTLRPDSPVPDLHILFVSRNYPQLQQVLATTRNRPLLTVTEAEDALAHGSMINLVMVDGHVRFEVSHKAAQTNNVRISARLLAAATRVIVGR